MKRGILYVLVFLITVHFVSAICIDNVDGGEEYDIFGITVDGNVYTITISPNHQSIFKMKGTTGSSMVERINWTTDTSFSWSNGIVVDDYWLVNPSSYTKEGVGYSMVGFMPEMKNTDVVIYGYYYDMVDSVVVHIK